MKTIFCYYYCENELMKACVAIKFVYFIFPLNSSQVSGLGLK